MTFDRISKHFDGTDNPFRKCIGDKVGVLVISSELRVISNVDDGTCIVTVLGIGEVSSNIIDWDPTSISVSMSILPIIHHTRGR